MDRIITPRLLLLGFLAISLSFTACRKDEEEEISINEGDAAQIISSTLSDNSDALEDHAETSAQLSGNQAAAYDSLCGNPLSYNRIINISRNGRTFDYEANGVRDAICLNDSLIAFQYTSTFTTRYTGPKYSSNGTGSRNGRLDEIRSDSTFYLWTGNTEKNSNGTLETRNETYRINSNLKYNSILKIDKTIRRISSGNTTYSLSGGGDNVRDFAYSGTITYLGNRRAEVVVNGSVYTVNY